MMDVYKARQITKAIIRHSLESASHELARSTEGDYRDCRRYVELLAGKTEAEIFWYLCEHFIFQA